MDKESLTLTGDLHKALRISVFTQYVIEAKQITDDVVIRQYVMKDTHTARSTQCMEMAIINPRCACAVRVTVAGSVCLSVCYQTYHL